MRVKKFEENRTFKTTFSFNKPLSFKTQLNKVDNLNTTFIDSSQKIEAKLIVEVSKDMVVKKSM